MGVSVNVHSKSTEQGSSEAFRIHLLKRESVIVLVILGGIGLVALILAAILFPSMVILSTFFYFAYILLFTLPMWAGLLEDDFEEESRRHDAHG